MHISLDQGQASYQIQKCEPTAIVINGKPYQHTTFIMPELLLNDFAGLQYSELNDSHIIKLLSYQAEVMLIGTGIKQQFLPPELMQIFHSHLKTVEMMDTSAACRTYTVLMSEGRTVAALLFIGNQYDR